MSRAKVVAVFGSSATAPSSADWAGAERAGSRLAAAGLSVVTGGYGGTMEAASSGAREAGGNVIGVTVPGLFTSRTGANSHVGQEIAAKTLLDRIRILTDLADGVVALPGSIGTAAEFVVSWNLNHIARLHGGTRIPTVAVGDPWRNLWALLSGEAGAEAGDVHVVDTVDEAIDWLLEQPEIR